MHQIVPFSEVLEAADQLPVEDQQELIAILLRRIAQARRLQLKSDIEKSRQEFAAGQCHAATPEDLLREILM